MGVFRAEKTIVGPVVEVKGTRKLGLRGVTSEWSARVHEKNTFAVQDKIVWKRSTASKPLIGETTQKRAENAQTEATAALQRKIGIRPSKNS